MAERLAGTILSGGYGLGDRLPPERELVESLGVSRTVVREALNLLESRGLVRIEHGKGATVDAGGARAVRNTLRLLLHAQPTTMKELLEIRKILEIEVASLAAERATTEDLDTMRAALEKMRRMIHAPEGYVDADVEFHSLLAGSARNRVLLLMIEPITDLLLDSRRMTGSREENARRALAAHEAILERVQARDSKGARREMHKHLMTTEQDIEVALSANTAENGSGGSADTV